VWEVSARRRRNIGIGLRRSASNPNFRKKETHVRDRSQSLIAPLFAFAAWMAGFCWVFVHLA
jgi:hypothetical protein